MGGARDCAMTTATKSPHVKRASPASSRCPELAPTPTCGQVGFKFTFEEQSGRDEFVSPRPFGQIASALYSVSTVMVPRARETQAQIF